MREFLKRKNIEISAKRYGIDALGAMAQGLFCSLLIGTIIKTLGQQLSLSFLVDVGQFAFDMSGPAMAVAIGYALKADPMVLFSLTAVGWSANKLGGAGGPLAVLFIASIAAEIGKMVSKETKVDILVTPAVTVFVGAGLSLLIAPPIGAAAKAFGQLIQDATVLQPFWMGIVVAVLVGIALKMNDPAGGVASGMGTCGFVGQIGVWSGWVNDVALGVKAAITPFDWLGMALICFILPAVLSWFFCEMLRKIGWIREGDLVLPQ